MRHRCHAAHGAAALRAHVHRRPAARPRWGHGRDRAGRDRDRRVSPRRGCRDRVVAGFHCGGTALEHGGTGHRLPVRLDPTRRLGTSMSGWWRANRAWLAALPVAAAVGAGASAYQVRTFWWESGMHRKVAAPVGGCAQAPGIRTLRAATISADRSRPRPRLLRGNRQPPAGISRGTSGTRWPLANEERVMRLIPIEGVVGV
ncbi:hypothetical protein BN11_1380007 [Nostocoides australiense Ben110]|uniref:Uncharacterized protein n=1 Tax=Nostocoides australiense Ben110 TaxID=1193182 RepID=W6JUD3_9MICO|nr:hypothetical protein BN11_1380007 [Tetrasphaera australiensis Ben110]